MATTKTPVMGLNKPAKGDFDWDVPLNENWDKLDKLGAGQLPLLSWIDVDYVLTGDAALGWAQQGSTLDGNTYTSLWTFMKAAYDRGTAKNEVHYGKTYSVRTDATTELRFVTEAVYNQAFSDLGESLGHVVDTANGAKKIILRKSWKTYDLARSFAAGSVGTVVDEQLPNIKGTSEWYGVSGKNGSASGVFTRSIKSGGETYGGSGDKNIVDFGFDASRSSSTYKDGAKVMPQTKYVLRYYKVGNTIVNQDQIDLGNLTKEIQELQTNKANTNLINVDATGKANAIDWNKPNYKAGVAMTSPYTAPKAGFIIGIHNLSDNGVRSLTINSVELYNTKTGASYLGGKTAGFCYPVAKGDVISWTNFDKMTFYPNKGV